MFQPLYIPGTNEMIWTYEQYLKSRHWQCVRWQFEQLFPKVCVLCGSIHKVQIHHKTYERIGHESPWDLVYLCETCHKSWHNYLNYNKAIEKSLYKQQRYFMRF